MKRYTVVQMVDNENANVNTDVQEEKKDVLKFTPEIKEVSSCERHIKVTIPREEIDRYFDIQYEDLRQNAAVPGFRKGKAPRRLIEKKFRADVIDKVKSALILDSYNEISEMDSLTPISEPDLNIEKIILPEDGEFVYEFNIEVRPEFELPNWKGIRLEKVVREVTDEDIEDAIKNLQERFASLEEIDEPVGSDTYIQTKLSFIHNGNVISKADKEIIRVRPVLTFHDSTINDFDKLMEGAKAGDVISTKTIISIDAPNPILAGKEVEAKFEVIKVMKQVLPELTPEFLYELGNFEDRAQLCDSLRDVLARQFEYEQQKNFRKQITTSLLQGANWNLPPVLLRRQSEREIIRTRMELERSGYEDRQIDTLINYSRRNIFATTEQALKEHFILEKIAEVEQIEDTQADYDMEIALMAAQSGESVRRIRSRIENAGNMDILRNQIIERKVIALIQEEAVLEEVPYKKDETKETKNEEALDFPAAGETEAEKTEESAE